MAFSWTLRFSEAHKTWTVTAKKEKMNCFAPCFLIFMWCSKGLGFDGFEVFLLQECLCFLRETFTSCLALKMLVSGKLEKLQLHKSIKIKQLGRRGALESLQIFAAGCSHENINLSKLGVTYSTKLVQKSIGANVKKPFVHWSLVLNACSNAVMN